jgi:hypothetical protein
MYQNISICDIGIRNRSKCIYRLHSVHSKIKIYLHMTLDTEKYQIVSIRDFGYRKRINCIYIHGITYRNRLKGTDT